MTERYWDFHTLAPKFQNGNDINLYIWFFSVQVSRHHDGEHSEKEEKSPVPGIFEGSISDFPQCMQKVSSESKLKISVFV